MPYSSISVTFEWWEHRPEDVLQSVAWKHHKVIRKVPLRKTRAAQSRVVERYFLKLMAKRVTATTDVDGGFASWVVPNRAQDRYHVDVI